MFAWRGRAAFSLRRALFVLLIWVAALTWLWTWWIRAASTANLPLYIPLSLAMVYEYTVIPATFLYFLLKAKRPIARRPWTGKKVAVITPCVPSQESLAVIEKQLKAMSEITYPHDSWILDEGGLKDIRKLARQHGVHYFTRKNKKKYNQKVYPFKAKTKAGNINAWLHRVRSQDYEFFVQLDIDHLPHPNYLDKTLGHFRDEHVAWVQAPSVYSNLDNWIARGATEQDMGMQGPLQMGFYGANEAPLVIGSHTTFRMSAIREIGGFQQTRAEDHLNTLALMSQGWKGVFLPEVIAEGEGPETLTAYLSQQYAWAYSMFQIFKTHSWAHLRKFSLRHKLQYIFIQTWYPLWSLSYFVFYLVPILGLLSNSYALDSSGGDFVYRFGPVFAASLLILWASKPILQPRDLNLTWRGLILHVARWPIILMAIWSAATGKAKPYQITPKGRFLRNVPTVKLYRPFLMLSLLSVAAIFYSIAHYGTTSGSNGLIVFAVANLMSLLSICLLDLDIRLRQAKLRLDSFKKYWLKPTMAITGVMLLASISIFSAVQTNISTTYASKLDNPPVAARDLAHIPPALLTDEELGRELASPAYVLPPHQLPTVGVYSLDKLPQDTEPYIRHTFVDWREDRKLAVELLTTIRKGNTPFITVEPKGEADGAKLLRDIVNGQHDQTIDNFLWIVSQTPNDVYLRFAHEMDFKNLYPWGDQDGTLFIQAYRHVVDRARQQGISNIKWVWGPGGILGATKYYPGDDVVDVIGTTVLYDRYWTGDRYIPFNDLVSGRLWLERYHKPVWITEFGVGKFNPVYQQKIVKEGVDKYRAYGFSALVYINLPDSNLDGPDYTFDNPNQLVKLLGLAKPPAPKPVKPHPTVKLQADSIQDLLAPK